MHKITDRQSVGEWMRKIKTQQRQRRRWWDDDENKNAQEQFHLLVCLYLLMFFSLFHLIAHLHFHFAFVFYKKINCISFKKWKRKEKRKYICFLRLFFFFLYKIIHKFILQFHRITVDAFAPIDHIWTVMSSWRRIQNRIWICEWIFARYD